MPRKARIDAPGALHHIICRGIERRRIFYDNADRDDFVEAGFKEVNNWFQSIDYLYTIHETHNFLGVPLSFLNIAVSIIKNLNLKKTLE